MRIILVTLLLYFSWAIADKCVVIDGAQCCGLVVGTFPSAFGITETLAQNHNFFVDEGINVCFQRVSGSINLYDNLLASGAIEVACSQIDNAVWRRINNNVNLTVLAGTDGARGFHLVGNTKNLNGWNSVAALQGKTVVVDSVDSGYIVGLRKVLADYNVTNVTYVTFGTNRLPIVVNGSLNGQRIDATMVDGTAPYLLDYPAVALTQQMEHICPIQGAGYVTNTNWVTNSTNRETLRKFFRALLRSYNYHNDPANRAEVNAFIANKYAPLSDPNKIELIYDDYYKNPAAGLNAYLVPRKAGLRNMVNTRIVLGMSPYPAEGVEGFIADKVGGFVDLGPLKAAQSDLEISNNYDTDIGLLGCPTGNRGVVTTAPPPPPPSPKLTCAADYSIYSQPPYAGTILNAGLSITVNNASLLQVNGVAGWKITFVAKGRDSTPAFTIFNSWNTASATYTTASDGTKTYTLTNDQNNARTPQYLGFLAATTLPSPYNNICAISINGVLCSVSSTDTASATC